MANGSKVLAWVERDVFTERGAGCRFVVLFMHQTVRTQTPPRNPRPAWRRKRTCRLMQLEVRQRHAALAAPTVDKRAHHRKGEGREAAIKDRPAITREMALCLTARSSRLDESVGVLSQARP